LDNDDSDYNSWHSENSSEENYPKKHKNNPFLSTSFDGSNFLKKRIQKIKIQA
jgi:hypothetical protein